jgi:hypothetical protein
MNILDASRILNDCQRIQKLAGLQAMYPYTIEQLAEAGMSIKTTLEAQLTETRAALKLSDMQKRAAEARSKKVYPHAPSSFAEQTAPDVDGHG